MLSYLASSGMLWTPYYCRSDPVVPPCFCPTCCGQRSDVPCRITNALTSPSLDALPERSVRGSPSAQEEISSFPRSSYLVQEPVDKPRSIPKTSEGGNLGAEKTLCPPSSSDSLIAPTKFIPEAESFQSSILNPGANDDVASQRNIQSLPGPGSHLFLLQRNSIEHDLPQGKSQGDQATDSLEVTNILSLSPAGETLSVSASDVSSEYELLSSSETSFSDDMGSDESDPYSTPSYYATPRDWAAFDSVLLPLQDKVLAYLIAQASHQSSTTHSPGTQSADATGQGKYASAASQQKSKDSRDSSKRPRSSANSGSGSSKENNDEEDDEDPQRCTVGGQLGENMSPYFAYPFAKYNPLRYSKCARLRFENVSRIKTHLRLRHMRPIHCAICNKIFQGDQAEKEFAAHQRARNCTKQQRCLIDGITKAQQKELIRRMGQRRGRTETEKWYAIWDVILHPEPPPDSPHNDEFVDAAVLDYQHYSQQMMHTVMEEISSTLPQDRQGPSVDQLTSFFTWLYPEFQRRVHERWVLSTRGSSPTRHTSSSLSESPDGGSWIAPTTTPASSGRQHSGSAANFDVGNLDVSDEPLRNYLDADEQPGPLHTPQYAAPSLETTQEPPGYDLQPTEIIFPGQERPDPLTSAETTSYQSLSYLPGSAAPEERRLSREEFIEMLRNTTDAEFLRFHAGETSRLEMIDHLCRIDEAEYACTHPSR